MFLPEQLHSVCQVTQARQNDSNSVPQKLRDLAPLSHYSRMRGQPRVRAAKLASHTPTQMKCRDEGGAVKHSLTSCLTLGQFIQRILWCTALAFKTQRANTTSLHAHTQHAHTCTYTTKCHTGTATERPCPRKRACVVVRTRTRTCVP